MNWLSCCCTVDTFELNFVICVIARARCACLQGRFEVEDILNFIKEESSEPLWPDEMDRVGMKKTDVNRTEL